MSRINIHNKSITKALQNSVISPKKNRKKQPIIENDIQSCLPECLQIYIIEKQLIDISKDLKLINPDIGELFMKYNQIYFDNKLEFCIVQWSDTYKHPVNMYENSGYCYYNGKICYIYLSKPILQYRPTKEIIETLIHEMIHGYLYLMDVHHHDRSDHGKRFISIMNAINYSTKYIKITVYHYCHSEMDEIKISIFQCNGVCQKIVRRPNNKPPGKHEKWWNKHKNQCNGIFIKVNEINEKRERQKINKNNNNKKRKRNINDNNMNEVKILSPPPNKKRKIQEKKVKINKNKKVNSWICSLCTLVNSAESNQCEICDTKKNKKNNKNNDDTHDSDIEILN